MDWNEAQRLSELHGDGFFLYDEARLAANFAEIRDAFAAAYPATRVAYSYKTNYTPAVCRCIDRLGGYAEVVSHMEYGLARRIGVDGSRIIYNGPCKSEDSVREALLGGSIVNMDSWRDCDLVLQTARGAPRRMLNASIRCNFPVNEGPRSRFGLEVDGSEFRAVLGAIRDAGNLRLAGLHCHFPSRDIESYAVRADRMLELASALFSTPPDFLDIGGGFFGHVPDSMRAGLKVRVPSFAEYADVVGGRFRRAYPAGGGTPVLFIEPGTAIVADTFTFLTKVLDLKTVAGRRIATVAGSIFNISPNARCTTLPVTVLRRTADADPEADGPVDVAGYTCIESDYLSRSLPGPLSVGDFLVYHQVGSYSVVMKPPFILPATPILKREGDGGGCVPVKRRETCDYVFENFTVP